MSLQGEKTAAWFQRARANLVNGVSSGFRYWGEDDSLVIDHGDGAYVVDMDGRRYVDYQCGFGPIILGHGHPAVAAAVADAAASGTTFAMTSRREVEAAEKFRAAVSWVDALRFTNTGTEATMHAIRLARGFTGRDIVLKFEGQYHGVHDYVMFSTASAPLGAGIPIPSDPDPKLVRHTGRHPIDDQDASVQRLGSGAAAVSGHRTQDRGDHRRADARQRIRHPARGRLPPGA